MPLDVFPTCRHRGAQAAAGVHRCHSPKLIGLKLVTADLCGRCYCRDHDPGGQPPALGTDRARPCAYRGQPTGAVRACATCNGQVRLKEFACRHPGHADRPTTTEPDCRACADYAAPDRFFPVPGDPPCGVVVGSYGWPRLVELQINVIRHTCGPVPVLVSDDCSPGFGPPVEPGGKFDRLQEACARYPDVTLWPNVERIGHTGGDVAAYWKGLQWAHARGLRVLAKLSQRFLLARSRWLQDGARTLLESELPLATQRCRGREVFDLRTEAMLVDVTQWYRPDVLGRLLPRRYAGTGKLAEAVLQEALGDCLGGIFWPWDVYTEERYHATPGVVWHTANTPGDYRDLAALFGLGLDADFTTDGWQNDPEYLLG
jgi:hypothetical protein